MFYAYRTLSKTTDGSLIGFGKQFGWLSGLNIPLAKMVDFVPLGALSGPGAPDPDLARLRSGLIGFTGANTLVNVTDSETSVIPC